MEKQSVQQLCEQARTAICSVMHVGVEQITDLTPMKLGMTNRSFLFTLDKQRYILRLPGEGTAKLIDRPGEALVYQQVIPLGLTDDILYLDPKSGIKITRYLEGARICNAHNERDLCRCMALLRRFHGQKLEVKREFDLFFTIEFYESLRGGQPSVYPDYGETKQKILELRPYLNAQAKAKILCHLDTVAANFLFAPDEQGGETLRLIDWEYSAMQDPDVDLAMLAVSDLPRREEADHLIDLYYTEGCSPETRVKIHAYMAVCGLLWSNWCEYKHLLGVEFGPYAQQQYRCAVEYADLAWREIEEGEK